MSTTLVAVFGIAAWLLPQRGLRDAFTHSAGVVMPQASEEAPEAASPSDPSAGEAVSRAPPSIDVAEERDWLSDYTESTDLYAFVTDAVPRALAGDHRAQYFVGQALLDCKTLVATVNLARKGSFIANVEETMASYQLHEPARRRMTEHIRRCEGFFTDNPVANLAEEQQQFRYWSDRALAGNDAFALIDRALKRGVGEEAVHTPSGPSERRSGVLSDIRQALSTREPAVIFKVGALYSNPTFARNADVQGPAWLLAACSAGYDCSVTNTNVGFGCAQAGECDAGRTIANDLELSLAPAKYAAAYAAGQDILYKIETGDWDGLESYLDARL